MVSRSARGRRKRRSQLVNQAERFTCFHRISFVFWTSHKHSSKKNRKKAPSGGFLPKITIVIVSLHLLIIQSNVWRVRHLLIRQVSHLCRRCTKLFQKARVHWILGRLRQRWLDWKRRKVIWDRKIKSLIDLVLGVPSIFYLLTQAK